MLPVILGIILGIAVGLINFSLLIKTAEKVSKISPEKVGVYVIVQYLIRVALYAGAIIISVLFNEVNALATGVAIVAVGMIYFIKYYYPKSKVNKESD